MEQCLYQGARGVCIVQFTALEFSGQVLYATARYQGSTAISTGALVMTTEGYGCVVFFCQWGKGPTLNDPMCSWPKMCAAPNTFFSGAGSRDLEMDFTEAINEAKKTSGCCTRNSSCGCMLRGYATFYDADNNEVSKVYMGFTCNFSANTCSIAGFENSNSTIAIN